MKAKYHLIKKKVYVQFTDGSVYQSNIFLKSPMLKLNLDPKSHSLWKKVTDTVTIKNYKTIFMNKFFYKDNK
ncbi:hypothetical protein HAM_018 (mitochondrion) [Hemiselmis andersenii]|uniref:Ribosomal protein L31 n=1 Tax=Hemiselmis andersenii TaxID=464988 RepID=B2MWT2_HEMAN|nr:hypothetical protein HAM_018 [Hemiselmis andersenii]ACC78224.1 hypothetical protein HAM_018 [Hemiselmis andersenii]